MRKLLATTGVVAAILLTVEALAVGAIAVDSAKGDQWGWAVGHKTQAEADTHAHALRECGPSCSIVRRFSNTCAAFAADQSRGSTAYGHAPTSGEAQANAMGFCRQYGSTNANCVIRAWGCDADPVEMPPAPMSQGDAPSTRTSAEEPYIAATVRYSFLDEPLRERRPKYQGATFAWSLDSVADAIEEATTVDCRDSHGHHRLSDGNGNMCMDLYGLMTSRDDRSRRRARCGCVTIGTSFDRIWTVEPFFGVGHSMELAQEDVSARCERWLEELRRRGFAATCRTERQCKCFDGVEQ